MEQLLVHKIPDTRQFLHFDYDFKLVHVMLKRSIVAHNLVPSSTKFEHHELFAVNVLNTLSQGKFTELLLEAERTARDFLVFLKTVKQKPWYYEDDSSYLRSTPHFNNGQFSVV